MSYLSIGAGPDSAVLRLLIGSIRKPGVKYYLSSYPWLFRLFRLTAALGLPFALGPTLSDGGVASYSGLLHVPVSHVLLFLVDVDLAIDSS